MEYLGIPTGPLTVKWEENTSCISIVEAKWISPRVKHTETSIYFLKGKYNKDIFTPKYEKATIIPEDMCTRP